MIIKVTNNAIINEDKIFDFVREEEGDMKDFFSLVFNADREEWPYC